MTGQLAPSNWVKCISTHGSIRGVAIQGTALVREIAKLHKLSGDSARGLGEAVLGALLIGSYCKGGQRVNLNIQGSGFFQQALVEAYPEGRVRGYVIERQGMIALEEGVGPWGTGFLSLLRTRDEDIGKPYIGTVPLLTGHLAKDLSFYWVQSEQIPTAVGIVVNLDGDEVASAGAFMVQAMPGADASDVAMVEQHISEINSLGQVLTQASRPLEILGQIFQSTAFMTVEEKPVEFKCNCSWDRVRRAIALVGAAEIQAMIVEDKGAVVRCDFCTHEYRMEIPELEGLARSLSAPAKK